MNIDGATEELLAAIRAAKEAKREADDAAKNARSELEGKKRAHQGNITRCRNLIVSLVARLQGRILEANSASVYDSKSEPMEYKSKPVERIVTWTFGTPTLATVEYVIRHNESDTGGTLIRLLSRPGHDMHDTDVGDVAVVSTDAIERNFIDTVRLVSHSQVR